LRARADLQNFKILSLASACLRGDRGKIYAPCFKQAVAMKFYAAFQKTSASARLQKLQTSREISYRRIRLAAIKYACQADAVKFRTAL